MEPVGSVAAMLRDFQRRRADPTSPYWHLRDNIVDWCAEAPDLRTAIHRAVRSRRPNGKFHHHQSKQSPYLPAYEAVLMAHRNRLRRARDFHELYLLLRGYTVRGIAQMAWYDIGTRIGAYLRLEPEKLYMHTGVLMGLKALNQVGYDIDLRAREWIEIEELPVCLRKVKPDFAEDFLCTYREAIILLKAREDGTTGRLATASGGSRVRLQAAQG